MEADLATASADKLCRAPADVEDEGRAAFIALEVPFADAGLSRAASILPARGTEIGEPGLLLT